MFYDLLTHNEYAFAINDIVILTFSILRVSSCWQWGDLILRRQGRPRTLDGSTEVNSSRHHTVRTFMSPTERPEGNVRSPHASGGG